MTRRVSILDSLPKLITARDVLEPIHSVLQQDALIVPIKESWIETCMEEGCDFDQIFLVVDGTRPVASVGSIELLDPELEGTRVRDAADPISPDALVAANTRALDLLELFATRDNVYYLVLDGHAIIGFVNYRGLLGPAFKLLLLGLALNLEDVALGLIRRQPKQSFLRLSPGRQQKASEVFQMRRIDAKEKPSEKELLYYTSFCDKGFIVAKRKLVATVTNRELTSCFAVAETIRNRCAHTSPSEDDIAQMDAKSLFKAVSLILRCTAAIAEQLDAPIQLDATGVEC